MLYGLDLSLRSIRTTSLKPRLVKVFTRLRSFEARSIGCLALGAAPVGAAPWTWSAEITALTIWLSWVWFNVSAIVELRGLQGQPLRRSFMKYSGPATGLPCRFS